MKLSIFYELNFINIHSLCQQKFSQRMNLQNFKRLLTSVYIYETSIRLITSFDTFLNIVHVHHSLTFAIVYFHSPVVLHPLHLHKRFVPFLSLHATILYNLLKFVTNSFHLQSGNSQFFLLVLGVVLNGIDR